MERLEFDRLFRWFVGLSADEPAWDHSTFSKNHDRLLDGELAANFLAAVLNRPNVKGLLSTQHFSADGTLIEAWASLKSFKPNPGEGGGAGAPPEDAAGGDGGGSGGRNAYVKRERRSNATHRSTTDPEALLYRKGPGMEAKLCYIGNGLIENRSGLIVDTRLTLVSGHAERLAALEMIASHADRPRAITLGVDKGYDAADFVDELRTLNVRPACGAEALPLSDRRADDPACRLSTSQRFRERIEEALGWIKTGGDPGEESGDHRRPCFQSSKRA